MRKLILFFSLSLLFMDCDPQGGRTQPQPYKRPFPTKAYYNGDLFCSFDLDSNDNLLGFTITHQIQSIVSFTTIKVELILFIAFLTAESLGTTGLIQPLTVSTCADLMILLGITITAYDSLLRISNIFRPLPLGIMNMN